MGATQALRDRPTAAALARQLSHAPESAPYVYNHSSAEKSYGRIFTCASETHADRCILFFRRTRYCTLALPAHTC
jgi:hypothetical protein